MPRLSISSADGPIITLDGRRTVSFGGCNYLGLSFHPDVQRAMVDGLKEFGISSSASRETTGNTTAHDRLEVAIREFLNVEAAVVVPDGYTANLATAQALGGTHRVAVVDARCHRSIRESIASAGMRLVEYAHRDADEAAARVRASAEEGMVSVWTDGVFAADGAIAPVVELARVCGEVGATLVVDDCHGLCTLGRGGRGTVSHFGIDAGAGHIVVTSTLAKGLGCHGGFIAGTNLIADLVRAQATAYVCTTPVSPAIAAAAVEAIRVLEREPGLVERLRGNAGLLARELRGAGIEVADAGTPIFAFTLADATEMTGLHEHLLRDGHLAPLISYPDGPAASYFRVSVTSGHTEEQIRGLGRSIRAWAGRGGRLQRV